MIQVTIFDDFKKITQEIVEYSNGTCEVINFKDFDGVEDENKEYYTGDSELISGITVELEKTKFEVDYKHDGEIGQRILIIEKSL